jgi:serine protease AprX
VIGLSLDSVVGVAAGKAERDKGFSSDVQPLRAGLGVPASARGAGVGVAIIDSGVAHARLEASASYDFTGSRTKAVLPSDPYGHGTHVAGLIAGNGATAGGRYAGVAPAAHIISLRVLNEKGSGYVSDVIEAINFAVRNRRLLDIDIINLSLGHPIY